jgi:hypothetical protein
MSYSETVLAIHPDEMLAYWSLGEASGNIAYDLSGNGHHGTYSNVVLGQPSFEDDETAAGFDGATSVLDVWSADLAANFTPGEFTISLWFKIPLEVWTNAHTGRLFTFQVDAGNRVLLQKNAQSNQLSTIYNATGANKTKTVSDFSPVYWTHWALTVSKTANAMRVYLSGAQNGLAINGLGTWAGMLTNGSTVIGGQSGFGPVSVLSGSLAHMAVWNTVLTAEEIGSLALADPSLSDRHYIAQSRTFEFIAQLRSCEFEGNG